MWLFPLAAAIVSAAFAWSVVRSWWAKRTPHLLAWSLALAMFSAASLAAALGMLATWTPALFRTYYYFGAIVNVPILALGTMYLLAPRPIAHGVTALVAVVAAYALFAVYGADISEAPLRTTGIPPGSEVIEPSVRNLSRYASFAGFFVVVGGALWSASRLRRDGTERARRLAAANVLIAAGTFVVAVGSGFARYGQGSYFALGLLAGVALMFAGFLRARDAGRVRVGA